MPFSLVVPVNHADFRSRAELPDFDAGMRYQFYNCHFVDCDFTQLSLADVYFINCYFERCSDIELMHGATLYQCITVEQRLFTEPVFSPVLLRYAS